VHGAHRLKVSFDESCLAEQVGNDMVARLGAGMIEREGTANGQFQHLGQEYVAIAGVRSCVLRRPRLTPLRPLISLIWR